MSEQIVHANTGGAWICCQLTDTPGVLARTVYFWMKRDGIRETQFATEWTDSQSDVEKWLGEIVAGNMPNCNTRIP